MGYQRDCKKERETVLKAIRFQQPDYIPMNFHINASCFQAYPQEELFDLMESHPFLFPEFVRPRGHYQPALGNNERADRPYVDDWGCRWETVMDGITGTVTKHPLESWEQFAAYRTPDPRVCMGVGPVDWEEEGRKIAARKEQGALTSCGLRHGHTFLQLCDIRGYENAIFDMEDEEPGLWELLEAITEFNLYIIRQYLDFGVDILTYAEDLGMQAGPMLSPENFQKYILPCYEKSVAPVKESGTILHMHSDGDIRTLAPFLLGCGMDVLNLQDLVNGLDWIEENLKGRVCIELDIDRQKVTPFGTPREIDGLIAQEVSRLGSPDGGLMMIYGLYPGVPLENVKALMDAMEKYAFYFR